MLQPAGEVLSQYDVDHFTTIAPFGTGLINSTWLVQGARSSYILQKINDKVFTNPLAIAANTTAIEAYLRKHAPQYMFVAPVHSCKQQPMVYLPEHGYFRLIPFVAGSHTVDVAASPQQAYEAARQFGSFTNMLSSFPVELLQVTLPGFHDLPQRFSHFELAIKTGNTQRVAACQADANYLLSQASIVSQFSKMIASGKLKRRATHHDTKISNVLFDEQDKGLCVIDLDTVMPGYFISDVGDMMRTYLCAVSEEEKDISAIQIRVDYFEAIARGYLSQMLQQLSEFEVSHFYYSGLFMIYMQAIRFMTDHLNNDVYYGAAYQGHNLVRAQNQIELLHQYLQLQPELQALVRQVLQDLQKES